MAEIKKYTAQVGLQPAPEPNVRISNVLGEVVEGLGRSISSAAAVFEQRKQERDNFKAQNDWQQFQLDVGREMDERAQNMQPGGEGFHDDFIANVFRPKRDAFLASLPEKQREKFAVMLDDASGAAATEWSIKAAGKERDELYRWSGELINQTTQQLANAINIEPEQYEKLLQDGYNYIDSSPLPAATKETAKRQWQDMAMVSHATRILETNPERLILDLDADISHMSPTTQYELLEQALIQQESGGRANAVSPKGAIGLMQVMPGTARDIAKELKDPNFNPAWDPQQVSAYISNPAVNKRYGRYYLQKQLRAYKDIDAALIAYNGGPGRANAWLKAGRDDSVLPEETRKYYKAIRERLGADRKAGMQPNAVSFVRDGAVLDPNDGRMRAVSQDLRDRVSTAFASLGIDKVKITSGFRDPEANRKAGGADNSQHLHGKALDIDVSGLSNERRIEIIRALSANGITGFGIGANIIHADIGPRRAWGYATSKGGAPVPPWAKEVIDEHLAGRLTAPGAGAPAGVNGRYATMSFEQRQRFINAADTAITKRYDESVKADVTSRIAIRDQMASELASLATTGQSTGLDPTKIADLLGEEAYVKFIEGRDTANLVFKATSGMSLLTDDQINDRVETYRAEPGAENFAEQLKVEKAVENEAKRVRELRTKDPARAVLGTPAVAELYAKAEQSLLTGKPDRATMQDFIANVMLAQEELGIPPENRAPIPKNWAVQIGRLMYSGVPELAAGNKEEVRDRIAKAYMMVEAIFGDYAEEVSTYSVTEYKGVSRNMAELITGYMQLIEAGKDPLKMNTVSKAIDKDQVERFSVFGSIRNWLFGGDDDEGMSAEELLRQSEREGDGEVATP